MRVLAIRDVANDEAERRFAGLRLVRDVERRDQATAPEARAVGALAPTLVEAPSVAASLMNAVEQAHLGERIVRIKQGIRMPDALLRGVAGHSADTRVPALHLAITIKRDQRIVADARDDGVDPCQALAQRAIPMHRHRHIVEHRHESCFVQLEQGEREDLRQTAARRSCVDLQLHAIADHAMPIAVRLCPMAQIGRHVAEDIEEVEEFAVAGKRHQQLSGHRIDHHDIAFDRRLNEPDGCHVEKLRQCLELFGSSGRCRSHRVNCAATQARSASPHRAQPAAAT